MGNLASCTMPNLAQFGEAKPNSYDIDVDDYQTLREVNDPRFGAVRLMKSKSRDHSLYIKEKDINYFASQLDEMKFRSQLANPYLLEIYGFRREDTENRIQIYFEKFDGDLEKDIQQAIKDDNPFSEEKLNIILHCTLNALSYLQENNVAHENITPANILRIGDRYKLYENSILGGGAILYHRALKGSNLRYLAPELLAHFARNDAYPSQYSFKADIYALGVCLLDAGVLDVGGSALIDYRKLETVQESLQSRLKKFKERYSPQLSRVIEEMLCVDHNKRPDAITLYNRLPSGARGGKKRVFSPRRDAPQQIDSARSKSPGMSDGAKKTSRLENILSQEPVSVVHHVLPRRLEENKAVTEAPLSQRIEKHLQSVTKVLVGNFEEKPKKNEDQQPIFTFAGTNPSVKGEARVDYSRMKDMKVSENILNDPVLSKFVKKMYEQQGAGFYTSPEPSNNKSVISEPSSKTESPQRKYSFLNSRIEEILQKHSTKNSSLRSSPGSNNTTRRVIAAIPETKSKGSQDFGTASLEHSFARYSKPTDLPPSNQPVSRLNGSISERQNVIASPSMNFNTLQHNFSPSSYSHRSPEPKSDPSLFYKSNFHERSPIPRHLDDDIDAKVKAALLKSAQNLEKVKASGTVTAFNQPHSPREDPPTLRSSFYNPSGSRSFQDQPFAYQSADKFDSALKMSALTVAPFDHSSASTARALTDYHKLSNDELAKLVSDIKKEFQPKLEMFGLHQSKAELSYPASTKSTTVKRFEFSTPVAHRDSGSLEKNDLGTEVREKVISNGKPMSEQIEELKKEIQSYFIKETPAGNK